MVVVAVVAGGLNEQKKTKQELQEGHNQEVFAMMLFLSDDQDSMCSLSLGQYALHNDRLVEAELVSVVVLASVTVVAVVGFD